jgi:hypothetical protein
MSHELNLAIALPSQLLAFALPAVVLIAIVFIVVLPRSRRKKATMATWAAASDELGLEFVVNGIELGSVARGRVNNHVVSIAPAHKGCKNRVVTQYSVKFKAPEAPEFNLVKRINKNTPIIGTGNPEFDAVVAVKTDQPEALSRYLTGPRRAAILRLLTYFPSAQITNREAHLLTVGIEQEHDKLVDSICHLVAAAETFDHLNQSGDAHIANDARQDTGDITAPPAAGTVGPPATAPIATPIITERKVDRERGLLTEARLDAASVLDDLFNSELDDAAITARFQQTYQGHEVNWTGEVLRVGATEDGMKRIAALVGFAAGQAPESGRVVALTAIKPEPVVVQGDVVSFSGLLVNLVVGQRLLHIA